jgi:hypothetical protein
LDVLDADSLKPSTSSKCKHCSPDCPDYRPILVKILPVKGRKNDRYEILRLEVQPSKKEEYGLLPGDFWDFLGRPAYPKDKDPKVPIKHDLSPAEVNFFFLISSTFLCTVVYLECMRLKDMKHVYVTLESVKSSLSSLHPFLIKTQVADYLLVKFQRGCDLFFVRLYK